MPINDDNEPFDDETEYDTQALCEILAGIEELAGTSELRVTPPIKTFKYPTETAFTMDMIILTTKFPKGQHVRITLTLTNNKHASELRRKAVFLSSLEISSEDNTCYNHHIASTNLFGESAEDFCETIANKFLEAVDFVCKKALNSEKYAQFQLSFGIGKCGLPCTYKWRGKPKTTFDNFPFPHVPAMTKDDYKSVY